MPLVWIIAVCFLLVSATAPARAAAPEHVRLTWMSVSNWLIEVGQTRIILDGYISRIPEAAFSGPSFAYAEPSLPDTAAIQRVIEALGSPRIDCILTGHSHFDHAFDVATWARLTGARIVGARSTCLQAVAQGVPDARCTAVEGGELIPLGPYVSVRVVRWNHSGDTTTFEGKLLHAPLELTGPPTPTSAGLRPGILQDFPNGGGARAYLFTAQTAAGPVHWLYSNTGNATTFGQPVTIDEAFFSQRELALGSLHIAEHATPAREHLRAALTDAGLAGSMCGWDSATGRWPRPSTRSSGPRPTFPTTGTACFRRFLTACRTPTARFPCPPEWPTSGKNSGSTSCPPGSTWTPIG